MGVKARGTLVIIGGAEDKEGECVILKRFLALAGGSAANLVIMTAATAEATAAGVDYEGVFRRLGVSNLRVINVADRAAANDPERAAAVAASTGVYFTGGDQLRITSLLGGTRLNRALLKAYAGGTVIAGTSAGASAMSDVMIVGGNSAEAPTKDGLHMAPGMGLLEEIVIDQHFAQRGRTGRLLEAVAHNPYILGVGIDEDTAVVVSPDATFTVIGTNSVTIVDGMSITYTNVSEVERQDVLALTHVTLHILPAGFSFDLEKRRPVFPVLLESGARKNMTQEYKLSKTGNH
jgi:cyanophycinase